MSKENIRQKLTPPQIAASYGISVDKVHRWIAAGELRAINAATRRGGRPRFLIDVSDLEAFENSRAAVPEATPAPRRRRTQPASKPRFYAHA